MGIKKKSLGFKALDLGLPFFSKLSFLVSFYGILKTLLPIVINAGKGPFCCGGGQFLAHGLSENGCEKNPFAINVKRSEWP